MAAKPTAVSREFELTPSASKFRLAIFDWSQTKMRDQQRAKNPQDRSANNVGQIMRTDVHTRDADQNRAVALNLRDG